MNVHTQEALQRIQEVLPIMASAVGLSAEKEFGSVRLVENDDMTAELEIGDKFIVALQWEERPAGILDALTIALKEVEILSLSLDGGTYWQPSEIVERSIYKGPALADGLMKIVLQDRIDAIDAAMEHHEEQKACVAAGEMYAEAHEEFGISPR